MKVGIIVSDGEHVCVTLSVDRRPVGYEPTTGREPAGDKPILRNGRSSSTLLTDWSPKFSTEPPGQVGQLGRSFTVFFLPPTGKFTISRKLRLAYSLFLRVRISRFTIFLSQFLSDYLYIHSI